VTITKDRDTGEIRVNGKVGQALSWLKLFQPLMSALMIPAIIGAAAWARSVDRRVVEIPLEAATTYVTKAEFQDRVVEPGVLPDANRRLEALEKSQEKIEASLSTISVNVSDIAKDLAELRGALAPSRIIGGS